MWNVTQLCQNVTQSIELPWRVLSLVSCSILGHGIVLKWYTFKAATKRHLSITPLHKLNSKNVKGALDSYFVRKHLFQTYRKKKLFQSTSICSTIIDRNSLLNIMVLSNFPHCILFFTLCYVEVQILSH